MTGATVATSTGTGAAEGIGAFIWASWRAIDRSYVRLAVASGALLGGSVGLGNILTLRGAWWPNLIGGFLPVMTQALMLLLGFAIAVRVPPGRLPQWVPFAAAAAAATLIAALVEWGGNYVVSTMIGMPWNPDAREVLAYATGDAPTMLLIGVMAAFGCIHAIDARRRTEALRGMQLERTRVTRQSYEARLQALQARVEPRFLFETLHDIEELYETDADAAARMLDDLIAYLRAALPGLDDPSSTLGAELTLVRTWLDIASIRSRRRLAFALPDAESLADARMPPMLLVPLVQHAVDQRGEASSTRPVVFVSATLADTRLQIVVTGPAAAFAAGEDAGALKTIRERLLALYGADARLDCRLVEHELSRATLEIPYERTDRRPR